jgi:hypothetical protein
LLAGVMTDRAMSAFEESCRRRGQVPAVMWLEFRAAQSPGN